MATAKSKHPRQLVVSKPVGSSRLGSQHSKLRTLSQLCFQSMSLQMLEWLSRHINHIVLLTPVVCFPLARWLSHPSQPTLLRNGVVFRS